MMMMMNRRWLGHRTGAGCSGATVALQKHVWRQLLNEKAFMHCWGLTGSLVMFILLELDSLVERGVLGWIQLTRFLHSMVTC